MDFPKEELLEKYVNIYEEYIADYVPDFEVKDGTTRYVRFNDAWRGLNPFEKLLVSRLSERSGYLPVVKTPSVWQSTVKNQKYGNYLMQYQELMDQAILIPEVSESETFRKDLDHISETISESMSLDDDE